MANTISSNMSLIIPTVGSEPGPTYASDVNSSLTLIDQHDHSAGKGVQITPAGININSALNYNSNNITSLGVASFSLQSSTSSTAQSLYVAYGSENPAIGDLWYTDSSGNKVQLTSNGLVNATIASLPGQTYSSGTFIWKQGTGSTTPANFDIGSITIRPIIAGTSNGTILAANNSISSSFTLTLPLAIASSANSFLTSDASGNLTYVTPDGTTTSVTSGQLSAIFPFANQATVNAGVSTTQIVSPATLNGRTRSVTFSTPGANVWTLPGGAFAGMTILVSGRGGAGGGGGGAGNGATYENAGGAGGGGAVSYLVPYTLTSTDITNGYINYTVGAGGTGGAGGVSTSGSAGSAGSPSIFSTITFNNIGLGGAGGVRGTASTTSNGGAASFSFGGAGGNTETGNGGPNTSIANGGGNSLFASGGTGGGSTTTGVANFGGGGGGAGDGAGGNGGVAGTTATPPAGSAGTNGGGGGGGVGTNPGGTGSAGGNGSAGQITVYYP